MTPQGRKIGILVRAAHERRRVLIADETEAPTLHLPLLDRLNLFRAGIQLDEVVVPHDVENRDTSTREQFNQHAGLVALRVFGRVTSIQAPQQIAGKHDHIRLMFPSDRD